jgi:UDP:flavonoid glycosyltransferase YjiC (YdhE family)
VHEIAELAAPIAATLAGIPWVTVGYGPLLQPEVADIAGEAVAPLWREKGLAAPRQAGLYKHLYVDPYPPLLQIPQIQDLPSIIRLRPAAGPKGTSLFPDRQIIYVTFGTFWNSGQAAVERFRAALTGSAEVGDEAIATVGSDVDPTVLDPLPANAKAHRFVPQDELLPRCACVVAHGGSGTLLGALAWGKPLLILPQFADQFYNAERAVDAGLALVLAPSQVTREAVAERVRKLLADVSFSERAAQAQGELAAMSDVETVLDRIEQL